jgi:hypothetical protein
MFNTAKEIYEGIFKGNLYIKIGIGCIILILMLGGCQYLNRKIGLEDDNVIEEFIEERIKEKTGLDLDLTPLSNELL